MTILMTDTYQHSGRYPHYTLALADYAREHSRDEKIPVMIRQYSSRPSDIYCDAYESLETAYHVYHLLVDAEQPFVPVSDRAV